MNRKEFLNSIGAVVGSMALAKDLKPSDLSSLKAEAAGASDENFWKLVRAQFALDPDWIYLNFGGLGACPLPVLNSYAEWSRSEELSPNAGHEEKLWSEVKVKLARVLGKTWRSSTAALKGST
jgi:hypothetical protein